MVRKKKNAKSKSSITNSKVASGNETTTSTSTEEVNPPPMSTPFGVSEKLSKDLTEEQDRLEEELQEYIMEFTAKEKAMKHKLHNLELMMLFVMNLHPRWKRLIEPIDYQLKTWEEAAAIAQWHAVKYSSLLGVKDSLFFQSKKAKHALQTGYFVPQSHPSKKEGAATSTTAASTASTSTAPPSRQRNHKADQQPTVDKSQTLNNPPKTTQADKSKHSAAASSTIPPPVSKPARAVSPSVSLSSESSSKSKNTANTRLSNANAKTQSVNKITEKPLEKPGVIKIPFFSNVTRVVSSDVNSSDLCRNIPKEHQNASLPCLELDFKGKKMLALVSEAWGYSAISSALVTRLDVPVDSSQDFVIATDFGYVTDTYGQVELDWVSPASSKHVIPKLRLQALPSIYGGKIEMVLGADFFVLCQASVDMREKVVRFKNAKAPLIMKKL
ncbi:uncharacterized protein BYT42DRAFT_564428 [Radiomyces spectabilis]|uniref:uncharacterized protein n=1 Tax=Radiomyces spectabilis TaxID=64574 RepID=UPI00222044F2|nr:uncharacterized protein BYT42DRAFT_564428 [Radiomyces spectabilis]KAI8385016.1 hypothetical protein BYT42DRAFT_564428 [Radiomyces spectabilis]